MYSLDTHGAFISNRVRTNTYRQALRWAVQPGAVVVDVGTGSGIFALLACKMGARRVYAIELGDIIQVARELAAANGFAERMTFFQAMSTQVDLPERADVVISDIHRPIPLFGLVISAIIDARRRFLAPGGRLIPRSATLWAAVVTAPHLHRRYLGVWGERKFGLNWAAARQLSINKWRLCHLGPDHLLVSPQCWGILDYRTITSPNLAGEFTWEMDHPGTAHGLLLWFDAEVAPGIGFSNAPGAPKLPFAQTFLPWPQPVGLTRGDLVAGSFSGHLVGEEYIWQWDTRILEPGKTPRPKADFHQSTFLGMPLSPAMFEQMSQSYLPGLNQAGLIERFILERMDGHNSLQEIAQQVAASFPGRFAQASEALGRVQELARKYSH